MGRKGRGGWRKNAVREAGAAKSMWCHVGEGAVGEHGKGHCAHGK